MKGVLFALIVAVALAVVTTATAADRRVAYGSFSLAVPDGWAQRSFSGTDSRVAQVSSSSLKGFDTGTFTVGQVVVWVQQLGRFGSRGSLTVRARDFKPTGFPDAGGVKATGFSRGYCAAGGRCFSVKALVFRVAPTPADVSAVNRLLRSLRVAP